ncbi:MAG TPA: tRNA lysidine(34) synthetase TilS [Candidatus Aphodovivens avistercoris]|nr:tRNA lysidine(34) synthetase TilS [Candidatus Aphodovivens avistercoris]
MERCIAERGLADPQTPVLLMVSGGSDSTALAYLAAELHGRGVLGSLGVLHVNHRLRGADADADEGFVRQLAALLDIPLFAHSVDVGALAAAEGGNVEAVARRERYRAADEALAELCRRAAMPVSEGSIFTAHTADDRAENFYMRSIVGTGPGGFRAMRYRNGRVCRPLLDVGRDALRDCLGERADAGLPVVRDESGALWREDATNAHTDRFRAFVRHEIVPRAKERNPHLLATLTRTMNLIADEDDMLQKQAQALIESAAEWVAPDSPAEGCVLQPAFGEAPVPLLRRAVAAILRDMLGIDARIETASVEAVLAGYHASGVPRGGYVTNIQGNLAVSANKHGVRIEPMSAFRARRKRG